MYRSCRAGRIVWQQLVSAPSRPLLPQAKHIQGIEKTTTHITNIATTATTITTRSFTSSSRIYEDPSKQAQSLDGQTAASVVTPTSPQSSSTEGKVSQKRNITAPENGRKIIFSGIQPTGIPHLGNYLGAMREWKRLQDTAEPDTKLIFSIVDLHALTIPRPREELFENRLRMMASLLAIGLNPDRATIFFQSSVGEHAELQWILSCTASTGYLSRMTQWKVSGDSLLGVLDSWGPSHELTQRRRARCSWAIMPPSTTPRRGSP